LGAQLVDDSTADANPRIPVKRGPAVVTLAERIDEAERACGDQVVAEDIRRQFPQNAGNHLVNQVHITGEFFTRRCGRDGVLDHARLHLGSPLERAELQCARRATEEIAANLDESSSEHGPVRVAVDPCENPRRKT
jgi:hypothetical protein